uniref:Uncharacterized protein n=1 Tax=Cacopsylla melanoneura TaxID=428564 RepID=A0A8D8TNU7_9HEMI
MFISLGPVSVSIISSISGVFRSNLLSNISQPTLRLCPFSFPPMQCPFLRPYPAVHCSFPLFPACENRFSFVSQFSINFPSDFFSTISSAIMFVSSDKNYITRLVTFKSIVSTSPPRMITFTLSFTFSLSFSLTNSSSRFVLSQLL